jgi:glutamine amidotransferase-like uncharacterized protein
LLLLIISGIGSSYAIDSNAAINVVYYNGPGVNTDDAHLGAYYRAIVAYNELHPDKHIGMEFLDNINNVNQLNGYDVLLVPGGHASGTEYPKGLNPDVVKQFVSTGHGYVGICAGAAYAIQQGFAPHIKFYNNPNAGSDSILGIHDGTGIRPELTGNWNYRGGPFMIVSPGGENLAYYDNSDYAAAIVKDWYGSGSCILFSPHPESEHFDKSYQHIDVLGDALNEVAN